MNRDKLPEVALRGGFSDRMGINPINAEMQVKSLDNRTRTGIINLVSWIYEKAFENDYNHSREQLARDLIENVYVQPISENYDAIFNSNTLFTQYINVTIRSDTYDAVLSLVEFIAQKIYQYSYWNVDVFGSFNGLFKKEYVGYRFVDGWLTPITNGEELSEINEAIDHACDNVKMHLEKALQLLSDRNAPDYENSIKESISAVEAMCSNILGESGTLGEMLKKIEKTKMVNIHPSLKEAFLKLYGFTCDADSGIRHSAKLGGVHSTFQEARWMFVSCTAFLNYMRGNMAEKDRQ